MKLIFNILGEGSAEDDENCAMMYKLTGKWSDRKCEELHKVICEVPASDTFPPKPPEPSYPPDRNTNLNFFKL